MTPDDPTLFWRVAAGIGIFLVLGILDWRRHPHNPTRVREYTFLLSVTILAMLYGVVHDLMTYTLSPNYYIFGKGITSAAEGFSLDVVWLALGATWTAGLIGAVALLLANNPSRWLPQLPYRRLVRFVSLPLGVSFTAEVLVGLAAFLCAPAVRTYFDLPSASSLIDDRFLLVAGMHWGAYGGGILGVVMACLMIRRARRRLALIEQNQPHALTAQALAPAT
jgi:hypothetical protein